MEREKRTPGKLERFAKNKVARATAAVALTFAAASAIEKTTGYDNFSNVEVAHADGPNLLPNPSFETDNSGLPLYYSKTSPALMGVNYPSQYPPTHSLAKDFSADVFDYNSGVCSNFGTNGLEVFTLNDSIVDTTNYRLSFWAKSDVSDSGWGARPYTVVHFLANDGTELGSADQQSFTPTAGVGNWEAFNKVIDPVPGTKKVLVEFNSAVDSFPPGTLPCTTGHVYATETFDDVSLNQIIPASVGGVAEVPDLSKLPAQDVKKDEKDNTLPIAVGLAAATVASGALLYSRRKKS